MWFIAKRATPLSRPWGESQDRTSTSFGTFFFVLTILAAASLGSTRSPALLQVRPFRPVVPVCARSIVHLAAHGHIMRFPADVHVRIRLRRRRRLHAQGCIPSG